MPYKSLLTSFLLILTVTVINAQAVKLATYDEAQTIKDGRVVDAKPGKPLTAFQQKETGGARVYFVFDIVNASAIKAKYRLELMVYKQKDGNEEYAYSYEFGIPKANGQIWVFSDFTEGSFVARFVNKDDNSDVYATANFTVGASAIPDYKHNSTFVFCKLVGDNWNPVSATTKMQAGTCIQFLYKAKDKIHDYFMMWCIRRVKADGSEEYVNDLQQDAGQDPYRFLATDDVCDFSQPGKYRVYLMSKNEYDSQHGVSENYFGMAEISVQ